MRYDNLAYKIDYTEDTFRQTKKGKKTVGKSRKEKSAAEKSKKRKKIFVLSMRVFGVAVVCAAASFMITKYVQLDALDKEAKALRSEVETMRSVTSQKIIEMEQGIDLSYIENQAEKLDMKRPEKYQQIYVDVKRADVADVTAGEAESFITVAREMVDNFVSNIIDRFSIR